MKEPLSLETVGEDTPIGTRVILMDDDQCASMIVTRSVPWYLGKHLVVKVVGRTGGYKAERCHVLPAIGEEITPAELTQLEALDASASQPPWAYTEHCGAQVCIGRIHAQEPGTVVLEKEGVFLFEISADAYSDHDEGGDDSEEHEARLEARAYTDAKLIALMRNYFPKLLRAARAVRGPS